jgi:hypothetical protein
LWSLRNAEQDHAGLRQRHALVLQEVALAPIRANDSNRDGRTGFGAHRAMIPNLRALPFAHLRF